MVSHNPCTSISTDYGQACQSLAGMHLHSGQYISGGRAVISLHMSSQMHQQTPAMTEEMVLKI